MCHDTKTSTDDTQASEGGYIPGRRSVTRISGPQGVVELLGELYSERKQAETELDYRTDELIEAERLIGELMASRKDAYRSVGDLKRAITVLEERFSKGIAGAAEETKALGQRVHRMRGVVFRYADEIANLAVNEGKGLALPTFELQSTATDWGWLWIKARENVPCPVCKGEGKWTPVHESLQEVPCAACYGRKVVNPEHAEFVARVYSSGYWIADADREMEV